MNKLSNMALLGFVVASASTAIGADLDAKAIALIKSDFHAKGIATADRLDQDPVQAACSKQDATLTPAQMQALEKTQMDTIRYPADGKFLGDWKKGETLAQDGRGNTWSDKPDGPVGGNCYNCHQISPQELSFGTLGPSLLHFGKLRGNTPEVQRNTWAKIYNAKATNLCSTMPRFGYVHALTEAQMKDVMALLLDPESPVNK